MLSRKVTEVLDKVESFGNMGKMTSQQKGQIKKLLKYAAPVFKTKNIKFNYYVPCIVCNNIGKDTHKVFSCHHSICLLCLGELLPQAIDGKVRCPLCKEGDTKIRQLTRYIKEENGFIVAKELFSLFKEKGAMCNACGKVQHDPEELFFPNCEHTYCKACVRQQVLYFMREKNTTKFELCCKKFITHQDVQSLLSQAEVLQFEKLAIMEIGFEDGIRFECDCSPGGKKYIFLVPKFYDEDPECPNCKQKYCIICQFKCIGEGHVCPEHHGLVPLKGKDLFFSCPSCNKTIGRYKGGYCVKCECGENVCTLCKQGLGKDYNYDSHFIENVFTKQCEGMQLMSLSHISMSFMSSSQVSTEPY